MNDVFNRTIQWYEKNAEEYSRKTSNHLENATLFTQNLKGKKILDVGCGPGYDTEMFSSMGYQATGVDLSRNFIKIAKQKFPKLKFIQGNFLLLPSSDDSFDGVWAQASLLHLKTIENVKNALKEFNRVLKPDGVLYVRVKRQVGTKKTEIKKDGRFFRYFEKQELQNLFNETGFSVISCEVCSWKKKRGLGISILGTK